MLAFPAELKSRLEAGGRGLVILAVRLGAMGDILRTLPPIRLVRHALPQATIEWVCDDKWTRVLEGHPDLDGLLPLPRKQLDAAAGAPLERLRLVSGFRRELRSREADLVLDFHGNVRSGLVGWWSGAAVRLGYSGHQQKEGNRLFTTHRVPAGGRRTPRMTRNLDLIAALGIPIAPLPGGGLPLVEVGAEAAAGVAAETGCTPAFALIAPAASRAQEYKIPPAELFARAARRLAEHGMPSLVAWGPGEEAYAERVVAASAGSARLAPPTDLPTLAALIARARVYIGADSGPLHLACAVGTPALAIYGPTDPVVNQPWGVPFRTVFPPGVNYSGIKREDRKHGFENLSADIVVDALDALLAEAPPTTPT